MPFILIDGCHIGMNIERISITAHVHFSNEYYRNYSNRVYVKMDELEEKLLKVIQEYFPDAGSEWLYNHEYKVHRFGH